MSIQKRETSLDLMKCIAMFFVLSCHTTYYTYDILENDISAYIGYFYRVFVSMSVPIFFFVNGFLLFRKEYELKKHVKKTIRLFLLSELWWCINIVASLLIEHCEVSVRDLFDFFIAGRDGWTNHLWYMGALVCIYIFFPLLKETYDRNTKVFIYFFIVCIILTMGNQLINEMGTIVNNVFRDGTRLITINWFKTYNPLREIHGFAFVYFCAGGIANLTFLKWEKLSEKKKVFVAVALIVISSFSLFGMGVLNTHIIGYIWDISWYGYNEIFTLVNVACVYVICANWKKDIFIIRSISQNTLGIYFLHIILIFLCEKIVSGFVWIKVLPFNMLYSLFLLVVSWLICVVIRKIPIIRGLIQ